MGVLAPGTLLGGCRIEAVVGKGGMGVVYRARQLDLDRDVAVKVISPELVEDPESRNRFLMEARAAGAVEHPNVVPVHHAGVFDGQPYLVMGFVLGDNLRTVVRRRQALTASRAGFITAQVGDALDAIHRAGYVHRDVKPQNVMLDDGGRAYLLDFGLAKEALATSGPTRSGTWVGTLDFVAPEQIRGERVDARADIYSLGGVLYFLLTGHVPFERSSDQAKLWAHVYAEAPRPSALRPELPPELDGVVQRALAKEPAQRQPSAGDLGRAARDAATGVGSIRREGVVARGAAAPRAVAKPGLPVPPNRTIGRRRELRAIGDRLRARSVRLLTLIGPGGVGKTRLALEAARAVQPDFADGAFVVPLAALQRAEDVPAEIAAALGIVVLPGEQVDQGLERFLAAKDLLLVLDNFEHLVDAAPFVARLLEAGPAVTVLATSREPLSLHAEMRYPVSPLVAPEPETRADPNALGRVDAVALFVERARARDPSFALGGDNAEAVAEICRRVDGLPLGVELAAARCGSLSPSEIARRLDSTFGALGPAPRDAPARHQTLRATIEWSHNLLSDEEKSSFARFAVFAGGATVEAAESVTGAGIDVLDQLVSKSLVVAREHGEAPTRLEMLETVHAYALERLETDADSQAVRERHYRYFRALVEHHGSDRALWGPRRKIELAQLDAEIDNLHAALRWAVGRSDADSALSLCTALGSYWLTRARYEHAVAWTERALSLSEAHDPARRIRALCIKSWGLWPLGREVEHVAAMAEAEAEARTLAEPLVLAEVLRMRAHQEAIARRLDRTAALADEALRLAARAGDPWLIASISYAKAMAARTAPELRERVQRAAALLDAAGNRYQLAELLATAGAAALRLEADHDAVVYLERAVPIARELDSPFLWILLRGNLGLGSLLTGDVDTARQALVEQLTLCREMVALSLAPEGLAGLAAVAVVLGDLPRAGRLSGAATAHRHEGRQDRLDARLRALYLEPARRELGGAAWDALVRDGASLSVQDAIAYALEGQGTDTSPRVALHDRPTAVAERVRHVGSSDISRNREDV